MRPELDFEEFLKRAWVVPIAQPLYWEHTPDFRKSFNEIGKAKKILIYLDSCGGFAKIATQIAEVIYDARQQGIDVRVLTGNHCQSAAMTILMSVPKECRYAGSSTTFMIHSAFFTDPKTGRRMTGLSRRARYRIQAANNAQLKRLTCDSNISKDALRVYLKTMQDAWFNSEVAVKLGLVSAIV